MARRAQTVRIRDHFPFIPLEISLFVECSAPIGFLTAFSILVFVLEFLTGFISGILSVIRILSTKIGISQEYKHMLLRLKAKRRRLGIEILPWLGAVATARILPERSEGIRATSEIGDRRFSEILT